MVFPQLWTLHLSVLIFFFAILSTSHLIFEVLCGFSYSTLVSISRKTVASAENFVTCLLITFIVHIWICSKAKNQWRCLWDSVDSLPVLWNSFFFFLPIPLFHLSTCVVCYARCIFKSLWWQVLSIASEI